MPAALLIDDDARLGKLVAEYLQRNDITVTVAGDGERGLALLGEGPGASRSPKGEASGKTGFDVVLLDLMLPGIDGLEVCKRIRKEPRTSRVPVIMLTAKGDDVDRIVGLEIGADDYLPKPFNPRELLARIRALLRRANGAAAAPAEQPAKTEPFRAGDLEVDFDAHRVIVGGKAKELTRFEFELLGALVRGANRVQSRDRLMDLLKGEEFESFDRSIDVHVSRVRAKIGARWIKTVRGVGYMFTTEDES